MHYLDIELNGLDENGEIGKYKLSDFEGENLIVYFYPQDDTPVCTVEANAFKNALKSLEKYAKVIGVSSDSIEDHKDFKEKYDLNFLLLSDENDELKNAFKDHNPTIQVLQRATFILDKNGDCIKFWDKVDVENHIDEIIEYFECA